MLFLSKPIPDLFNAYKLVGDSLSDALMELSEQIYLEVGPACTFTAAVSFPILSRIHDEYAAQHSWIDAFRVNTASVYTCGSVGMRIIVHGILREDDPIIIQVTSKKTDDERWFYLYV